MAAIQPQAWPEMSEYERNRSAFTSEQLAPYEGQWVAFSADGKRIVAAAPDLIELDQRVIEAGEDPQQVWLELIDFNAICLGAAELFG